MGSNKINIIKFCSSTKVWEVCILHSVYTVMFKEANCTIRNPSWGTMKLIPNTRLEFTSKVTVILHLCELPEQLQNSCSCKHNPSVSSCNCKQGCRGLLFTFYSKYTLLCSTKSYIKECMVHTLFRVC